MLADSTLPPHVVSGLRAVGNLLKPTDNHSSLHKTRVSPLVSLTESTSYGSDTEENPYTGERPSSLPKVNQGPVVQSYVSLTTLLKRQLIKYMQNTLSNTLFSWKKCEIRFSHVFNKKQKCICDIFMPPTLKKWGEYCFRLVRPSVCPSIKKYFKARVLKFHIWIPRQKMAYPYFFLV